MRALDDKFCVQLSPRDLCLEVTDGLSPSAVLADHHRVRQALDALPDLEVVAAAVPVELERESPHLPFTLAKLTASNWNGLAYFLEMAVSRRNCYKKELTEKWLGMTRSFAFGVNR